VTANTQSPKLEDLLRRAAWARRLARHLVRRPEDADDLLQDAWLVANEKAATAQGVSRPWLAGVLRVLGMNQARSAGRRRQRESEAVATPVAGPPDGTAAPDELLNQVETQRCLSEALLALDEPYRTTVLLRYFEELSAAEIARRTQVPAGTVRWRLKEGLERLRQQLDERPRERASWALALASFAEQPVRKGLPRLALAGGLTAVAAGFAVLVAVQVVRPARRAPAPIAEHPTRNEAHRAPGKDSDMKTRIGVLAAAASLAVQAAPTQAAGPALEAIVASKVPRYQVPLGAGPMKGPATAKVTILAFMDYQAPFCLRASRTMESLLAAHPGEVRYQVIHRPLPFHTQATYASKAAFAAGQQGKFWEMHATLLENQEALEPVAIEGYAKKLGLDLARFRADVVGPTVANQADREEANAQSVNITGVPMVFLNGRLIVGAQPLPVFEQALVEELAHADAVLKAGVRPADLYTTITTRAASQLPGPALPAGEEPSSGGPGTAAFQATQKVLGDNVALANACFEDGKTHRADLAGRVVIDVKLASGQQPRVLLQESTLNFPKVDNCVVQALKKLSYPELKTGGPIVARRTFSFPPEPASGSPGR
jgi:RNA polymerase sigma factor (sigma-70 family)